MEVGISTLCLGNAPITLDALERLRKTGFTRIELHANRSAFDFRNKSLVRSIARWFGENSLPTPSLHLPFEEDFEPGRPRPLSVIDEYPQQRQRALDEIKRCLELTDLIRTDYVVLHLGIPEQAFHPLAFDHAYAAIAAVQSFSGCRVLIENLQNGIASLQRIPEFVAVAQLTNVGLCYDSGHDDAAGTAGFDSVAGFDAMHLNDNDGRSDQHRWPFDGTRSWPMFVETLVISKFSGPLILEARDDRLHVARECRSRLQDLIDEANGSIEEFRLKYKLAARNTEEDR